MAIAKGFTMRNVGKWSKHLKESMQGATKRRLARLRARERGKMATKWLPLEKKDIVQFESILKAETKAEKTQRDKLLSLERNVLVKVVADTTLKNLKVKKAIYAQKYPRLVKALTKLMRIHAQSGRPSNEIRQEESAALKEIVRICGIDLAEAIVDEAKNLLEIGMQTEFESR